MRRRILAAAALVGMGLAAGWILLPRAAPAGAVFHGYVEGEALYLGPEEAGRLVRLGPRAGDSVTAGTFLFEMDTAIPAAQRDEMQARRDQARAQLANLRMAQSRPEQVAVLQAAEARARAALDFSERAFERQSSLAERGVAPRAQLDEARANRDRDRAALAEAQRQITAARLAGRSAEIDAAEAALAAAEAALRQAEARLAKRRVAAPADGVVQEILFRPGEAVAAGQPVLALLPPGNRKLRFYVPEPRAAGIAVGAPVTVSCDGCGPGLPARTSFAAAEVEFTPPVLFSREERARLVLRMEARFEGGAPPLPLGLPVQVTPRP